ncbi:MAG: hypothetical protein AMJ62_06925 [Myxococcales bacterium SG8_38]|nr:MAG: hypothetical protein AMJ62_06925 [Myxococcales bacterium SG8_38]
MTKLCNGKGRVAAVLALLATLLMPEAASAEVVTLPELEAIALQSRARWEAIEATTERADAEVDAARAGLRPSFWVNVGAIAAPGSNIERVEATDGRVVNVRASPTVGERTAFRPNARYEGIVQMRAPLYDGQNRAAIEAAEAYHAAARASSTASRQQVLVVVRASYLDWLAAYLDHDFAAAASNDAAVERERISDRVADGDVPASDLDDARYQELQAELEAANAGARLADARLAVEAAAGVELSAEATPDLGLLAIQADESDTGADWEAEALERERDAARQEARMHRKSRAPVLAVVGQTGVAGVNDRVFPMYQLGVNLAVPLWDGGRAVAMANAADARAIELGAHARDARLASDDERAQAILDRQQSEQQLGLAGELVSVAERRVEQAQASYELGEASVEAVAAARTALREAQMRRVQIQVIRADAILRLNEEERSVTPDVLEQ